MKLLLLGSQHGNERLGDALYAHLQAHHTDLLPHITFMIGNPRAHKKNVRYTESDLNRSYDPTLTTYESRRARRIQSYIKKMDFNIVLDLHTTNCKQPPCIIIPTISPKNEAYLRASFIDRVVLLQNPIVKTSLIGVCTEAISIEINRDSVTTDILEQLASDIRRFLQHEALNIPRFAYLVNSLLLKSEVSASEGKTLINFEPTTRGYIPILTGENSYKQNTHYLGFKAVKQQVIKL